MLLLFWTFQYCWNWIILIRILSLIKGNSQVLQISGLLGLHSPPPQLTLKGESTCTNKRALNYNKKKNKDKRELLQRNVLQHQQFLGYAKLLEPIYSCRSFYQRRLLLFAASFWWGEGITMVCSTEKKNDKMLSLFMRSHLIQHKN